MTAPGVGGLAEVLGDLTVRHIGREVEFSVGGATYRATLVSVQHEHNFQGYPRTMVSLKSGEWRHVKTYPADTPCHALSPTSAPGTDAPEQETLTP